MRHSPAESGPAVDSTDADNTGAVELFVLTEYPALRQALVARYGVEAGSDAAAAALAWAWENWLRLETVDNVVAYLYRVAQSSQRSNWTWRRRTTARFPTEARAGDDTAAVDLGLVVGTLPDRQRVCVLLVHAHGWSYADVALLLDISVDAVTNHVHRGTKRLRKLLQEEP
jgi:DNA-directed RNA polymerase specialized sigma24 family protein